MTIQTPLPHAPLRHDAITFWYRQATRLQRKVNCSWWLQFFCPVLLGLSLVGSGVILIERYLYAHSTYGWAGFGITTAIAVLFCLWWARPRFYSQRDGLVHLEAALLEATLRLHNRLSAAHAGVGSWPPPQVVRDGLRWRWFDLTWPFVLAGTALTVAAWLPLPSPVPQLPTLAQPPIAWERIETALETLEQSHLLQAKAVDMFREPLAQLQQRPSQQWYTHHILEASDTLRAQLEHALEALEHDIQQLTAALNSLGQLPASGPHASTQLHDSFNQARDQLTLGHLPLNEQVLDMLNRIDRDTLRGLSQSKLSDLKEQLRQGTAVIRDARRHSRYGREIPFAEQDHALATEPCPFERREPCVPRGQSGEKGAMIQQGMHWSGETGEREITRGPGSAPLALNPRPKQSRAERIEVIQGTNIADEHDDYTRKFSRSVPKVDPSQAHDLSPGGVARVDGHRDTIVWKYHFTPQERDVLEYVFK